MNAIENVINIATEEIGYLEKKSNNYLYDKTKNAGSNNYTKYWRDIYPGMQANAWCLCFVIWCFYKAFGDAKAKKLLCMEKQLTFYTPTAYTNFSKAGKVVKDPQPGDIIFFKNDTRICHVGLVTSITSSRITTIEGNTSGGNSLVANGGGVAKKNYNKTYNKIAGYCRPDYSIVSSSTSSTSSTTSKPTNSGYKYDYNTFVQDVCNILKANNVNDALSKTISLSSTRNKNHPLITPVEKYLKSLGLYTGQVEADKGKTPIFGSGLTSAVKKYQKDIVKATSKNIDGIISAKGPTWKSMLKV